MFDPMFSEKGEYEWIDFVSFDELLAQSDLISVHAPLNDHTRHMLNSAAFAKMKDGVLIVNTSRGGLINEHAFIEALKAGKVRRAQSGCSRHS